MTAKKRMKRKSLKKPATKRKASKRKSNTRRKLSTKKTKTQRVISKKKPTTRRKPLTKKSKTKRTVSKKKPATRRKLSTKKTKTQRAVSKKKSTTKLRKSKTIASKRRPRKNKAKLEVITYKDYARALDDPYKLLSILIEKESDKLIMLKKAARDEWKSIDEILEDAFDGQLTIGTKVSESDAVFFADKEDIHKFLTKPYRRDVKTRNLGMVQLKCEAVSPKRVTSDGPLGFPFIPGKSLPKSNVTINTLCTTLKEWERFKKVLRQKGRRQ